jgi:hypothetical protein
VRGDKQRAGGQEREGTSKSPKARKESNKREREEGSTSEGDTNPLGKSSRTGRSPSRSEEGDKCKEMNKKMKTMIREIREDTTGITEEKGIRGSERGERGVKERISGSERGDERKRRKMAGGGGRLDGKGLKMMEQREKKERKNNVIIGNRGNRRKYRERVEEWLEREIGVKLNVKEAFKINKDKTMLAKIESWEQKKNIRLKNKKLGSEEEHYAK